MAKNIARADTLRKRAGRINVDAMDRSMNLDLYAEKGKLYQAALGVYDASSSHSQILTALSRHTTAAVSCSESC